MSKSLDSEYLHYVDEASQKLFEKFKSDEESAKFAGSFLAGEGGYVTRGKIDKAIFEEAMSSDNHEGLREIFLQVPRENLFSLCSSNEVKVAASKSSRISGENHDEAIDHLKQIAGVEDKYDGVCVVKAKGDVREIGSENSDKPFSLHSIGKVLTGVLIAEMVARGIIPKDELTATGLKLGEDVRKALPEKVRQRVYEVTLHQTMTHHAGFHDYLPKYMDAIEGGVDSAEIPHPTNPRDFLIYANDKVKDHEGGTKKSYSNMGILLVGLVAEHYYNRDKPESEHKSYNEILQELVIEPAGMTGFSITPPAEALINPTSKVQPNMCGSPAGGYWATAHDMQNFAQHLCSRMQDERFRSAIENYGQEFYDKEKQVISHAGDIGAEGSAWFSVHIPSNTSCVMAQNSCFARMTGEQVSMVITSEQEREAAKSTDKQSFVERLGLPKKPLVIYIAETDHGDMSYSSFLRKVIEDCDSKGLSTKVFSEYESQTYKVNGMTHASNGDREKAIDGAPANIDEQLRVLRNPPSKETHIQTTEFLDRHFIPMGDLRKRWRELVPQTWKNLSEEIKRGTPENLLRHFEERGAIDNPAMLQMMKDDVTKGELPKEDGINDAATNAESYYRYWGGCFNYQPIHEVMAQDVKKGLAGQTAPDVIIMIVGKDRIPGFNQQFDLHLPDFADSQKVVIRNSKEVVIDKKIGTLIEFEFDKEKREAHIPDSLNAMISERSLSKKTTSSSEQLSPKQSWSAECVVIQQKEKV